MSCSNPSRRCPNPRLKLTGSEIRKKFLDYFAARGHRVVPSSSLVPVNDPTLLFTNAGMNQFKEVFLGLEQRDYSRAASSQKCVRAGGKHNDLENVGRTRRHHTFFEMLGNFSFGDYFKQDAIQYAWELVTREFGLPKEKLYVTVFREDDEAEKLWTGTAGVAADRVFRMDEADNFWSMGDTGPCGPCSEIHYDQGPAASEQGHADCAFPCECGRYVEIWNLVFMQFNRFCVKERAGFKTSEERAQHRHSSECLRRESLPQPSIDTGMGLERMAAIVQGKISNFETDLLYPLIERAAEMAGTSYGKKPAADVSLRILADHSRAAAFLVHDGVHPANEGRGYVLRKILRRAARHGKMLMLDGPFLYKMTGKVAEIMSDSYPELLESTQRVAAVVKSEEQRFALSMDDALKRWKELVSEEASQRVRAIPNILPEDWPSLLPYKNGLILPGEKLFQLYDTYGMPWDLMEELANEEGLKLDRAGFDEEMECQRERARASWKGVAKQIFPSVYGSVLARGFTKFDGYQQTTSYDCEVLALVANSELVDEIPAGTRAELVLDHTPFYAESGGQVGDTGLLFAEGTKEDQIGEEAAVVEDTQKPVSGVMANRVLDDGTIVPEADRILFSGIITHRITSRASLRVGDRLTAVVRTENRHATMRNHTATHLLHAALREVLGTHVKQAGSVVEPSRLRFDFAHFTSVEENELVEIERLVNAEVLKNSAVETDVMDLEQAVETGAMALFGEKYQDKVRVVSVHGFSKELCGGTHVSRTGDIGLFKITAEGSISAGVRRLEAVTGEKALEQFQAVTAMVHRVATVVKSSAADLVEMVEKVEKLAESERNLEKQVESLKLKMAQAQLTDLEARIRSVKQVKVLSLRLEALERSQMRSMADFLRQRLQSGVVVLATVSEGKVALIAALTKDLTSRLHAGKIAQAVARKLGGTGGGRPDIAEAGGKSVTELDSVLDEVYDIVGAML